MKKSLKDIWQNSRGIAILMLFTTIAILTALLAHFTFETSLNKYRVYNEQDRSQARLNAESGLSLAIARLKIYQETLNMLEKNKDMKKVVKTGDLNQIWEMPFAIPLPIPASAGLEERKVVEDFVKGLVIRGQIYTEIKNASNLLNVNFLRVASALADATPTPAPTPSSAGAAEDDVDEDFMVEKQIFKLWDRALLDKRDNDDAFMEVYPNVEARALVAALKHFVSDPASYRDEYVNQLESDYQNRNPVLKPKHAPLSSLSEIYLIEGMDDTIVNLIKDEITVHGEVTVDLNKLTQKGLLLLFPDLTADQIEEYFAYKNDPKDPKTFDSIDEFRSYMVEKAKIVAQNDFDERVKKFEKAGISFGTSSTLFRILSKGTYERATYTLTAYVTLDPKPKAKPKNPNATPTPDANGVIPPAPPAPTGTPAPQVLEYLPPKIVEISVN